MEFNVKKVVVKILQGSVVTQTTLGGANYTSSGCKFPVVYVCQKLWKLDHSRQSYCKNYLAYFFWPTLYNNYNTQRHRQTDRQTSLWC